jgi:hypothetical protein
MGLLSQQFLSGSWATLVNGWRYPPPEEGRFGDDFLRRAADQSLAGIAANDPAEAVYLVNFDDADGTKLSPEGHYQLRFGPGALPPVDAFWSLTAYTQQDMNLIPNAAHRYSVSDRTPGLRPDPDGGLTIYLQPGSPGADREPNWLPTSADNPWFVILRMYRPHPRWPRPNGNARASPESPDHQRPPGIGVPCPHERGTRDDRRGRYLPRGDGCWLTGDEP